jgi:hypothetical protein
VKDPVRYRCLIFAIFTRATSAVPASALLLGLANLAVASAQAQNYAESVLFTFTPGMDGSSPYAGLARDGQGQLVWHNNHQDNTYVFTESVHAWAGGDVYRNCDFQARCAARRRGRHIQGWDDRAGERIVKGRRREPYDFDSGGRYALDQGGGYAGDRNLAGSTSKVVKQVVN